MKYNIVKILLISTLAIYAKANVSNAAEEISSIDNTDEIIPNDGVVTNNNSITTKTIGYPNSNSRLKARQLDNEKFETFTLPTGYTDFNSILVPVDTSNDKIKLNYIDSNNNTVTYQYSFSGTKAIIIESTESGDKLVSFDYTTSGTKTINTANFYSKDNIKEYQPKNLIFNKDEEPEEGEEYDPFKYLAFPPNLYYDKEECGNNIYQKDDEFFCYRNNRLYDDTSSIDYLFKNMGIFYKEKSRYIHPVYESVCSGKDADIIRCYKNVAELLETDVFSIMPRINNTTLNVSEPSKNLTSSDSIIIEYFCGKDYFYSNQDKDACLRPYVGMTPTSIEEIFSKQLVHYKGEYYSIYTDYSTVCKLKDQLNCYMEIADVLGKNFLTLFPKLDDISDQSVLFEKLEKNTLLSKEEIMVVISENYCGEGLFYYRNNYNYLCLVPYEGEIPTNINEQLIQRIIFYEGKQYTAHPLYSSSFAKPYDVKNGDSIVFSDLIFNYYNSVAYILRQDIVSIIPLLSKVALPNIITESYLDEAQNFEAAKKTLSEYYCREINFYYSIVNRGGILYYNYACLKPYNGVYTSNINDMINKRIIYFKGNHYIIDDVLSNTCNLNQSSIQCFSNLYKMLKTTDAYSLYPKYNETLSNTEIFKSGKAGQDIEEIMDKYRCGINDFYSLDNVHVCLLPLKDDKSDFPEDLHTLREGLYLTFNNKYYQVHKEFSSIAVQREGYTDENYEIISKVLGVDKDSLIPNEVYSYGDTLEIADKIKACGEENFYYDSSDYVCLELYSNQENIPTSVEKILLEGIVSYKGKYYVAQPLYSSSFASPYDITKDDSVVLSDKIFNYYNMIAHLLQEKMVSIMPKLPNTNPPNLSINNRLSASENYEAMKMVQSEYYCGKGSFYRRNSMYVCLRPYTGEYTSNIKDMKNKKIVLYNGEYYIVHGIFSDVCDLKSSEIQCYSNLYKLLGTKDAYSLNPKYDGKILSESEILSKSLKEDDIEDIIDEYQCGSSNFYRRNNIHVCILPLPNGISDIPTDHDVAIEGLYLKYNGGFYKVRKEFSSIAVQRAEVSNENYSIISTLLGTNMDDIIP